jgi:hypothetical protein
LVAYAGNDTQYAEKRIPSKRLIYLEEIATMRPYRCRVMCGKAARMQ